MNVRTLRKIHRYLGLFVGVQLLLWTAGGLFFSLNSIERVRGETEASEPPFLQLTSPPESPAPALAELAARRPGIEVRSVTLRPHFGDGVYEIAYDDGGQSRWALADTRTGRLRSPISAGSRSPPSPHPGCGDCLTVGNPHRNCASTPVAPEG